MAKSALGSVDVLIVVARKTSTDPSYINDFSGKNMLFFVTL